MSIKPTFDYEAYQRNREIAQYVLEQNAVRVNQRREDANVAIGLLPDGSEPE